MRSLKPLAFLGVVVAVIALENASFLAPAILVAIVLASLVVVAAGPALAGLRGAPAWVFAVPLVAPAAWYVYATSLGPPDPGGAGWDYLLAIGLAAVELGLWLVSTLVGAAVVGSRARAARRGSA